MSLFGESTWRELRAEVESGIAAGQSLAEMQQSIKMEKYSESEGFDWVDEMFWVCITF